MSDYEKLGLFYLGRAFDLETKASKTDLILYDSRDLVTHAVCVGMTGSGKTGLCIALLEEAAIDGIPAIVIDPEGRSRQPAAHVPGLKPAGLRAVDQRGRARRRALDRRRSPQQQAELWRRGWQTGGRTARA